jgi:hypothetical protein
MGKDKVHRKTDIAEEPKIAVSIPTTAEVEAGPQFTEIANNPLTEPSDLDSNEIETSVSDEDSKGWNLQAEGRTFLRRLTRHAAKLLLDFFGLLIFITLSETLRLIIQRIYGDPKFFDVLPVRYCMDAVDLTLLLTFLIVAIREFGKGGGDEKF